MEKPAESYIHRMVELTQIHTRIPEDVKEQAESACDKLGTSMQRFIEASLRWYLEELKKEGSI